jgi:ABC-2 type transport system ATP-binding protein
VLQGTIPEVKRQFGSRHIRIAFENGGDPLDGTPLIESRADFGGGIEVHLAPNADTQDLLRYAAGKGRITRFEVSEPSLEEIFIEVIGARDAG